MKRLVFLLWFSLIFGFSCSKKEAAPVIVVIPKPCLLTGITIVQEIYSTVTIFTYNTENRLISVKETQSNGKDNVASIVNYKYTNGVLVSARATTLDNTPLNNEAFWTVQNGRVLKSEGNGLTVDIGYNAERIQSWQLKVSNGTEISYSPVIDADGNLKTDFYTYKQVAPTTYEESTTFAFSNFDSKNNPYGLIAKAMGVSYFFKETGARYMTEAISKNNPATVQKITTFPYGIQTSAYQYAYQYNTNDYVTQSTATAVGLPTIITTFEYSNCN
ncbi:MAG: hypothetical protein WDN75_17765 [Bacteroidota bacterium]